MNSAVWNNQNNPFSLVTNLTALSLVPDLIDKDGDLHELAWTKNSKLRLSELKWKSMLKGQCCQYLEVGTV